MKTFALYNLKGGVGKTTLCINLAYLAAASGLRTLVWDLDPQCAATFYLGAKEPLQADPENWFNRKHAFWGSIQPSQYPRLDILPGNIRNRRMDHLLSEHKKPAGRFRKALKTVRDDYDLVLIDCPPSLDLVAENIFKAADFVLFPLIPNALNERSLQRVLQFMSEKDYDPRLVVPIFNQVDRQRKQHRDTIDNFRRLKRKALRTEIPYSAIIEKMGVTGAPLPAYAPAAAPTQSFRNLWQELKMMPKLIPRAVLRAANH